MGILAITKKLIKRIILILPSGEVLLKRIVELRKANQLPSPAIEADKQLLIDPPNDLKKIFTSHYLNNIWGSEESVSGLGSTLEYTSHIREEIPKLLEFYKIKILLDAPCGDYNWFQTLNRPADVKYIGGDIVEELPLSQSTVSQHLKELKEAGLIKGEIEGAKVCYCIDEKEWKQAQAWLNKLFEMYKGGSSCC